MPAAARRKQRAQRLKLLGQFVREHSWGVMITVLIVIALVLFVCVIAGASPKQADEPQTAQDADTVYGDSFTRSGSAVTSIGNNVSLVWENMDFGTSTHAELRLDGQTPLSTNPVTIRFTSQDGEQLTSLAQFSGTERGVQCFDVNVLPGVCSVAFVFLPGSQFDFYGFTFVKQEEAAQ